ncbi:MAG: TerB family tellurite resistance protein [Flavobacteriales bacterium]|nr:TerB family tellurite resistance protein [Flavobacteriales bacterium]
MHIANYNKDEIAYLMLLILADADGSFDPREGNVIVDFIKNKFPAGSDLEQTLENLSYLRRDEYEKKLNELAEAFYKKSTPEERDEVVEFALEIVEADRQIAMEENLLVVTLFEAWEI